MELQGKIIAVMPVATGVSQRGEWKSVDFVIETSDQYPKKVCMRLFGKDKVDYFKYKAGDVIRAMFDIDAREYNGRWFNSVNCYHVDSVIGNVNNSHSSIASAQPVQSTAQESEEDLPF